jgi:hypothetical protein
MYLDDGLGGANTFEKCKEVSLVVKSYLFNFGFIIAEEKSNWNLVQVSIPESEFTFIFLSKPYR